MPNSDMVKRMYINLLRHKLITDAIIIVILLTLSIEVSMIGFSTSSRKSFSGIVYASPGVPVSSALVVASGPAGYGYATTSSFGQYLIDEGLETGIYNVSAMAEGYLYETIEDVAVTVGMETSNINFYLTLSGGISGSVTDAVSGLPLQNIMIVASTADGGTYGWSTVTDVNGNYSIITNLDTGTYNVTAIFPEGYVMKTVGGISVTAGVEVTGVNLALERSGIISGRVTTTPPSSAPLEGAMVTATSKDGSYVGLTYTNATGYYRIASGLGTGTYTVTALYSIGFGFGQITDVDVVAGVETSDIDFSLSVSPPTPSGIVTGRVTDIDSEAIVNALVTADGPAGFGEAYTDENGDYVISEGLGTGTYTVSASAAGYSTQQITGVSVTVDQVTSGINFQLSRIPPAQSGRISGAIEGDANPIPEFQYSIAILLIMTLVATVLLKLFDAKTKRFQLP
jgi:hypothetical protein